MIAATAELELAAVVTANPERAERARREHPGAEVLGSADELWKRAEELDLAVIASPNSSHVALAESALDAGLAVVVDKPLAPSAAEGRGLVELAEARGLLLTVFHNRRLDGDFLTARRLIEGGELGQVVRFESRFERWRPEVAPGRWRELAVPEEAGGVLFDLGSHLIDQALVLFGPPTRVYAEVAARRPGAQVDDDSFVALSHPGGVHSHLWMSQTAADPGPRFRVLGSRAAYVKHGLDQQEARLKGDDPPEERSELAAGDERRPLRTERGDYARFYAQLVNALRDGAPLPVDPRDAVAVLEVIEAAFGSARSGQCVSVVSET